MLKYNFVHNSKEKPRVVTDFFLFDPEFPINKKIPLFVFNLFESALLTLGIN
jgi:hypothetical protein